MVNLVVDLFDSLCQHLVDGRENGSDEVLHVDKCEFLRLKSH